MKTKVRRKKRIEINHKNKCSLLSLFLFILTVLLSFKYSSDCHKTFISYTFVVLKATATHPRPPSAARLKSPSPLLTLSWQLKSTGSSDTGFGTGSSRVVVAPDAEQQKEKVAGLAQMYTDPGLTDAATDGRYPPQGLPPPVF